MRGRTDARGEVDATLCDAGRRDLESVAGASAWKGVGVQQSGVPIVHLAACLPSHGNKSLVRDCDCKEEVSRRLRAGVGVESDERAKSVVVSDSVARLKGKAAPSVAI